MKKLLFLILFFQFVKLTYAQSDALDLSFGKKGFVRTDLGTKMDYSSVAKQVLTLYDGSMYVIFEAAGVTQIIKKKPNGTTDSTYGVKGYSTAVGIQSVHAALQADGKVVIAGGYHFAYNDFGLARFNTDGSLDKTFANNGIQHTDFYSYDDDATSIVIQKDGKIVVSGNAQVTQDDFSEATYNLAVARYNTDGSLDNTFGNDGKLTGNDNTLSNSGNTTLVSVIANGKIVITDFFDNSTDHYLKAIRLNKDGSKDNTFSLNINLANNDGSYFAVRSSVIQSDGKIVIGGGLGNADANYNFQLERFYSDGKLDRSFGNNGRVTTDFSGYDDFLNVLAIQSNGKIVAAGSASDGSNNAFAIARYNTNGRPDNSFDQDGQKINFFGSNNVTALAVAISDTGKIVSAGYDQLVSGTTNVAIAKYDINGSLDKTFNGAGSLIDSFKQGNTVYNSSVVQADGKIIVAGYTFNGTNNDFIIARYKTDGSLDSTFSGDGIVTADFGSDDYGNAIALQQDGKIVAAGSTNNNGSNNDFAIARFNTNGSFDNTFGYNGKLTTDFGGDESAAFVTVQSNGKMVAAGGNAIARYSSNGFLDVSFNGTGKLLVTDFDGFVPRAFDVQGDGKIIVTGVADLRYFLIARYKSNGGLDYTFGHNGSQETDFFPDYDDEDLDPFEDVSSVRIQPNGKIVVAGRASLDGRHGYTQTDVALARYNSDGSADNTFSDDGMETIGFADISNNPSISFRDNGKIVIKADLSDLVYVLDYGLDTYYHVDAGHAFASLNTDGSLDTTFASVGIQYARSTDDKIQSIAVSGNYLYAAGYTQMEGKLGFLSRYLFETNKPPIVSIVSPAHDTSYTAPATFTIRAEASDKDGTISSVKFYNGTTYLHSDFTNPYGYTFNDLSAGTYSITAKATDNLGAQTTSKVLTVTVKAPNKAPAVSIVSPANNTVYTAPATFTIRAEASDTDGTISSVKFYNGTTYLHSDFTNPYGYTFNDLPAGTYSITAKATDNMGAQTISAPVNVKVSNTAFVSNRASSENKKTALNDALSLRLSPNPATNIVNISASGLQQNKPATLSIISVSGIVLKTMHISNSSTQLDVSSLVSGVYMIKIISGNQKVYKKFVKL